MTSKHDLRHIVCPWWLGYWLLLPLRKFIHNPEVLRPHIREGMTVLDVGSGMGYFTLPLARMVGKTGKVIAVDIQDKMLEKLKKRAAKSGLADRIEARKIPQDTLGIGDLAEKVDVAAAFFVVHEMPDTAKAFSELHAVLKKGGLLFFAEPKDVIPQKEFEESVALAVKYGFTVKEDLKSFRMARGKILEK